MGSGLYHPEGYGHGTTPELSLQNDHLLCYLSEFSRAFPSDGPLLTMLDSCARCLAGHHRKLNTSYSRQTRNG